LNDRWILLDVPQVVKDKWAAKAVVVGQKPGSDDYEWNDLLNFQLPGSLAEIALRSTPIQ
jgi:hypothetical protein